MTALRKSFVLILISAGCSSKSAHKQTIPPGDPVAASAEAKPADAAQSATTPHVAVAGDITAACKLRFGTPEQAPKFSYDESELLPSDRDVLQQVADCLVKGPLAGRSVELVGRTDPRGTDEYNLGLGTRRAQTVRSYLQRLGVPAGHLSPTTRGEIDAAGDDESGWQRDRRVDLQLVN